jgi:antitoxin HigA-1
MPRAWPGNSLRWTRGHKARRDELPRVGVAPPQGRPLRPLVSQRERQLASDFLLSKTAMPSWWTTSMTTEVFMSSMFNPHHPGLTLRDDILPAVDLQVGAAATDLGNARTPLSKELNGRAAISPVMALRIERWLGQDHGGAAEVWLAQHAAYDLWQARQAVNASQVLSGIKTLKLQTN